MPAERTVVDLVRRSGLLPDNASTLFLSSSTTEGEETWTVARNHRGECVFFDIDHGHLCRIHRELGEEALPSACRHFPRKVLHDARGTLISLSHFCPTAAAALAASGDGSIVEAHAPLLLSSAMEGLDARDALPPLLRPGLLCDIEGYAAWERAGVAVFGRDGVRYQQCLTNLADATESIRGWTPGIEPMVHRVGAAFGRMQTGYRVHDAQPDRLVRRIAALTTGLTGHDFVPIADFEAEWERRVGEPGSWFDAGMRRYLAARLFGNWIAYQGRGLRSIVEWLRTCAAIVEHFALRRTIESGLPFDQPAFIEAVRSADLLLLHVLDSAAFARDVARIEEIEYA